MHNHTFVCPACHKSKRARPGTVHTCCTQEMVELNERWRIPAINDTKAWKELEAARLSCNPQATSLLVAPSPSNYVPAANEQHFLLDNGREYSVLNSGKPYRCFTTPFNATETEEGGFIIRTKLSNNTWGYICHAHSQEGVDNFIKAASRLKPLKH